MNARARLERLFHGGPAPVEAPPKPDVKPAAPPRERPLPSTPGPSRPDPFRRKTIKPGHEPRPKMRYQENVHKEAKDFLKRIGLSEFVK